MLAHIGNLICVGDDHLFCFFAAQIHKFRQHFFSRAEIKRRLIVRILEALAGHDDAPIDLILRVHEVHIAGSDHRFAVFVAQSHDALIDGDEIILRMDVDAVALDHEAVVAQRLDLQIVIKIDQPGDLLLRCTVQDRLVQFARLTG